MSDPTPDVDKIADSVLLRHFLRFDPYQMSVTGCQCGLRNNPEDDPYGDEVLRHIVRVALGQALGLV